MSSPWIYSCSLPGKTQETSKSLLHPVPYPGPIRIQLKPQPNPAESHLKSTTPVCPAPQQPAPRGSQKIPRPDSQPLGELIPNKGVLCFLQEPLPFPQAFSYLLSWHKSGCFEESLEVLTCSLYFSSLNVPKAVQSLFLSRKITASCCTWVKLHPSPPWNCWGGC